MIKTLNIGNICNKTYNTNKKLKRKQSRKKQKLKTEWWRTDWSHSVNLKRWSFLFLFFVLFLLWIKWSKLVFFFRQILLSINMKMVKKTLSFATTTTYNIIIH